jgi:hypothetical protein
MFARLMRLATLHLGLAVLALAAGCGSGDDEPAPEPASTSPAETTTATTTSKKPAKAGLAKPVYPTCGVRRFNEPVEVPLVAEGGGQYWRLVYQLPASAPRIEGQATQLTLVEQPPTVEGIGVEGGRDVVIAGKKVSLRRARPDTPSNVAQWRTKRARYSLLADGSIAELRRMIRCLP